MLGWVTLNTNPPPADSLTSGRVSWIKPAATSGDFYAGGFELETTLAGSRYTKPTPLLPLTNAVLALTGGDLEVPLTNCVTLTASNTIIHGGPNPLTMTITRSNGTFSGTLTLTNSNRALPFRGGPAAAANQRAGVLPRHPSARANLLRTSADRRVSLAGSSRPQQAAGKSAVAPCAHG